MKPGYVCQRFACLFLSVWVCAFGNLSTAQESAARLIRATEALTPEEELKKLRLPDGFTARLFAAEPMINKPINLAFDARGRLWVSSTTEYPYAAPTNRWTDAQGSRVRDSRDAIKILEDTNGDGRADRVTDFADGLNIPTGVLPWHKPEHKAGCIAWSIPNIWYFADTDGDGKCDHREVLFGPLGYERDTHGMCSSFRLGLDGWVYATHGFNNTSHFKVRPENLHGAKPGDPGTELTLNSGNVFRFRPDGSRIEIWSWGQVNPFGLVFDARGNLYSADCHSAPIYQLLHGAFYPSFGKPDDGLGFGPTMLSHTHGSTGICGLEVIEGGVWGEKWNGHLLVGNPVTSRVNHDLLTWRGATPVAKEQPDFITSDDLWFRPVDLRLGPDGALYVADFYNRIIGHYEVPLTHPGRDRERGRIWRIVPPGGASYASPTSNLERGARNSEPVTQLWQLQRAGKLDEATLLSALKSRDELVRIHALRVLAERGLQVASMSASASVDETRNGINAALQDASAHVGLAAAGALQQNPSLASLGPLLRLLDGTPADDTHLCHAARLALREHLKLSGAFAAAEKWKIANQPSGAMQSEFNAIARAVPSNEAAAYVFAMTRVAKPLDAEALLKSLLHVGRHGDSNRLADAVHFAHKHFTDDTLAQAEAIQSLHNGLAERGETRNESLLAWAQSLAFQLLADSKAKTEPDWTSVPFDKTAASESPWTLQKRKCADGREATVISSLNSAVQRAEQRTGVLRSKDFAPPPKLAFWLCGHRGLPGVPAHDKNLVRLVDAVTGVVLRHAFPPRNDVCQRVEWDLSAAAGRRVRLEVVDGDDGKSYAWLGLTRIEPPVVSVERFAGDDRRHKALRTLAEILRFTAPVGLRDQLAAYLPARNAPAPQPVSPEERAKLDALIRLRAGDFAKSRRDPARGAAVFAEFCAGCHRLENRGGLIGPQLDGIGTRGAERLCEDILDPNRNVDSHFFLHTFKLRDGSTLGGFVRGEAGAVWLIADANGQEQRVAKSDLAEDTVTPISLMPPVFAQTIPEPDFQNLLAYLLKSGVAPVK